MPSPTTGSGFEYSILTGDTLIDALISGVQWEITALTYSFPTLSSYWSTSYDEGYPDGSEPWTAGYDALTPSDAAAVQKALASWANVANLTFTKVADNASVVGDLRFAFATLSDDAQAWAYYPYGGALAGDVWFNSDGTSYTYEWTEGSYEYSTVVHEIGHALGLKHPFDDDWLTTAVLPTELDTMSYTVMSYSAYPDDTQSYFTYETTTPMVLDIAAIQALYGANTTFNAGDTTYSFSQNSSYHMTIWDAGGTDTIAYSSSTGGLIDLRSGIDGGSNLGVQVYAVDAGNQYHAINNIWIAYGATIENASGGSGDDTLIGNDADNVLTGNSGNDTFTGGAGNDTYVIDRLSEVGSINEAVEAGDDTVVVSFSGADLSIDLSAVTGVENIRIAGEGNFSLIGNSANNTLTGNTAANVIRGNAGNDTLDGKTGADVMYGGLGDDLYFVDNLQDVVVELADQGTDTVYLDIASKAMTFTLSDHLENVSLVSKVAANLTGNALNNTLVGNDADNRLDGGAGADTLNGGKGKDTYVVGAGDTIIETSTLAKEIDTVLSSASWSLGENLENLTLQGDSNIDALGNGLKNIIAGNTGDNVLDGGSGADKLSGGMGDDSYLVDLNTANRLEDALIEATAGGNDAVFLRGGNTALTSFTSLTLGKNLEILDASGTGSTRLNLKGNALDNILIGNAANNTLSGGNGADTLIGGAGVDLLVGGAGADSFVFNLAPVAGSPDLIKDFVHALDKIQLDNDIFLSLSSGSLNSGQFISGTAALDADDFIIYNSSNGMLYYDADGNGSTAAVEIVQLGSSKHPLLDAADIQIA